MSLAVIERFLDTYNLPWLILAILTWLLILFSCSSREFFYALPVGIWTMVVGAVLEEFFINHKFWTERFILIHLGELDLFVVVGPFFAIGLLLIKFLPGGRWGKFLIVLILSTLATGIELLATKLGFLVYHPTNWIPLQSFATYVLGLMSGLGFYFVFYDIPDQGTY